MPDRPGSSFDLDDHGGWPAAAAAAGTPRAPRKGRKTAPPSTEGRCPVEADSTEFCLAATAAAGEGMRTPDEVTAMLRLKELGWGELQSSCRRGAADRTLQAQRSGARAGLRVQFRKSFDTSHEPLAIALGDPLVG